MKTFLGKGRFNNSLDEIICFHFPETHFCSSCWQGFFCQAILQSLCCADFSECQLFLFLNLSFFFFFDYSPKPGHALPDTQVLCTLSLSSSVLPLSDIPLLDDFPCKRHGFPVRFHLPIPRSCLDAQLACPGIFSYMLIKFSLGFIPNFFHQQEE